MTYPTLDAYLGSPDPSSGPVAIILAEDRTAIARTLEHHARLGFGLILVIGPGGVLEGDAEGVVHIEEQIGDRDFAVGLLNRLIDRFAGRWVYWCFNAEFLYFPFMETRGIRDFTGFLEEERRDAVFSYVVDLYAGDLDRYPDGVSLDAAYFDGSGYYAFDRYRDGEALDRQFDVFGGLAWRFEQFVPWERRRIDRIALFRATEGLRIAPDLTLNEPEMNTVSCPWHHNATIAVASFRVAKSLKRNPGSMFEIDSFLWRRSLPFRWHSEQLLEEGIIEPGQWF
ncbi:glycosyltransferase family 2 protein [Roseobacter sp. HKCCA0434]|uniref:glycosyltransferase family 2 protein n=1 Tax=Roseobacter sp. HKCCA0434 TaxID=3079297 RepID=UPI002905B0E3|nr:hypothetical protein [Roseobacter sp. HKCCA0434]